MTISLSNERQFGFVIAYLIPGFLIVNGMALVSKTVANWLAVATAPTLGGFFYIILLSLLLGLVCSTIRWLLLDSLHGWTGLKAEKWTMQKLAQNLDAFEMIVAYHYRYYQFYGNVLVAIPLSTSFFIFEHGVTSANTFIICIVVFLELLFFFGSRDALKKYVIRSNELLQSTSIISL